MDIFGLVRITWLPRGHAPDPAPTRVPPAEPEPPPTRVPPAEPEPPPTRVQPAEPELPAPGADVVLSLIGLADDLAELTERDSGSQSGRNLRLVQFRVDQVLADCGVQVLRDDGPVVPARHQVVSSRPAGADGTAGWIAATVRSGYLQGDQLIRPQQVVAYSTEQATGRTGRSDDAGRG